MSFNIFRLAIPLMNRLTYSKKMLLVSAVFLVPIAILTYQLASKLGAEINFVRQERMGVEYMEPTLALLRDVQQHRRAANDFLSGESASLAVMVQAQTAIAEDIAAITTLEKSYAATFESGAKWQAIQAEWQSLQTDVEKMTAIESYSRHSALIDQILAFRTYIADKSNLTLDPNVDIYFLMISTVKTYPQITNLLSQMQASGANSLRNGGANDKDQLKLGVLSQLATANLTVVKGDMQQAFDYNPGLLTRLEGLAKEAQDSQDTFQSLVEDQLLNTKYTLTSSKEYLDTSDQAIENALALTTALEKAMDDLLLARLNLLVNQRLLAFIWAGVPVLLAVWLFAAFYISVMEALRNLQSVASNIAEGDVNHHVEYQAEDEMGQLAGSFRAMLSYLQNMAKVFEKMSENDLTENVSPKSARDVLGNSFSKMIANLREAIGRVSENAVVLSNASGQLATKTNFVATAVEEMNTNNLSVAAGMEQTDTNLHAVAAAVEEMTVTISEIAKNSDRAHSTTEQAARQVDQFSLVMQDLGESAQKIGKVTETITSISAQTNLLALNATIEAARAGAAGKGFTVVASEIKELAKQTAAATSEIKEKIATIQGSTAVALADIDQIVQIIRDVNEIVMSIAAATQEQATVTQDIAGNIAQASTGVRDANKRVAQTSTVSGSIAREIGELSGTSGQVNSVSAVALSQMADQLNQIVSNFKLLRDTSV